MVDDKNKDIVLRENEEKWLESSSKEDILKRLVVDKKLRDALKDVDAKFRKEVDVKSIEFKEYVKLLRIFLLGGDSEVIKLYDELEGKNKDIEDLKKQVDGFKDDIAAKESDINTFKEEVVRLKECITIKDKDIQGLSEDISIKEKEILRKEGVINALEKGVSVKSEEVEVLKRDVVEKDVEIKKLKIRLKKLKKELNKTEEELRSRSILNKGKKHIRGSEEFYRDILKCCSLIKTKININGEEYKDYRDALRYADNCETIKNYVDSNKVKLNRDNLKNWMSIAIALQRGEEPPVSIGKYSQSKGYK